MFHSIKYSHFLQKDVHGPSIVCPITEKGRQCRSACNVTLDEFT
jgi:hypothetical protein